MTTSVKRAVPLIGCGALLGAIVVLIVRTGGRFVLAMLGLAVLFALGFALLRLRARALAAHRFRARYGPEGKDVLIVYTDSARWKERIESQWLPKWGSRAVVLNRTLPWDPQALEAQLWFAARGIREHTPLAVVIPKRGRVRVVRFFNAFRDFAHGKDARLLAAERELEQALEDASRPGG